MVCREAGKLKNKTPPRINVNHPDLPSPRMFVEALDVSIPVYLNEPIFSVLWLSFDKTNGPLGGDNGLPETYFRAYAVVSQSTCL